MKKIGFVGFGRMAQAMYLGFERSKKVEASQCMVVEPCEENAQKALSLGLKLAALEVVSRQSDYLFICIKPQQLDALLEELQISADTLVISILAGKKLRHFEANLQSELGLVRVMPNTPALLGCAATGLFFNKHVKNEDKQFIKECFESIGTVLQVEEESLIDDITAISGSGPAFCYQLAKDWSEADLSLSHKDALALVAQTFIGAGTMLLAHPDPNALIAAVKSPGGTTAAGLEHYEKSNLGDAFKKVVTQCLLRAKELS